MSGSGSLASLGIFFEKRLSGFVIGLRCLDGGQGRWPSQHQAAPWLEGELAGYGVRWQPQQSHHWLCSPMVKLPSARYYGTDVLLCQI